MATRSRVLNPNLGEALSTTTLKTPTWRHLATVQTRAAPGCDQFQSLGRSSALLVPAMTLSTGIYNLRKHLLGLSTHMKEPHSERRRGSWVSPELVSAGEKQPARLSSHKCSSVSSRADQPGTATSARGAHRKAQKAKLSSCRIS